MSASVPVLAFFDVGFSELVVCSFVALLLFGGRLPEIMRNLGATVRNFKKGMEDLTRQATPKVLPPSNLSVPYRPTPSAPPPPSPPSSLKPMPPPTPPPNATPPAPPPPPIDDDLPLV